MMLAPVLALLGNHIVGYFDNFLLRELLSRVLLGEGDVECPDVITIWLDSEPSEISAATNSSLEVSVSSSLHSSAKVLLPQEKL